jgi:hypothetical protein
LLSPSITFGSTTSRRNSCVAVLLKPLESQATQKLLSPIYSRSVPAREGCTNFTRQDRYPFQAGYPLARHTVAPAARTVLHVPRLRTLALLRRWRSLPEQPTSCRRQRNLHNCRPEQVQQTEQPYSITSSASASSLSGTVRTSALAVVRLMTSSNLVGCSTGMSATLAPCRILSTMSATRWNRSGIFGP